MFLIYNGLNSILDSTIQKIFPMILVFLQIIEMSCYKVIYGHVLQHHHNMFNNQIVSKDVYLTRKHKHLFSIYSHIGGFVVEVTYLAALSLVKLFGRKLLSKHTLDFLNILKITEFGAISTVQIFMSPDLRQKLILEIKEKLLRKKWTWNIGSTDFNL